MKTPRLVMAKSALNTVGRVPIVEQYMIWLNSGDLNTDIALGTVRPHCSLKRVKLTNKFLDCLLNLCFLL